MEYEFHGAKLFSFTIEEQVPEEKKF